MLSYFYPPDTSGGVPRTVKFIKYLERLGWRATVVAPDWPAARPTDAGDEFALSIPDGTEVIRAGTGNDDTGTWKALHRLPLFWRVEPTARDALQYPDRFAVWARTALPAGRATLTRGRYQILYSTSPPVTSHWIALRLKREFRLPWVADFRDPWTDNAITYGNPPAWRRRLDLRLEHTVYREADGIIANTESNRETLIRRHGVSPEKVVTITNGFDEEDFAGVVGTPPKDRFRITYSGSFYGPYNPSSFLVALQALLDRRPDAAIEVTFAGSACDWVSENVRDPDLLRRIDLRGRIPNRHVQALLMQSHLLLHTYPRGVPYSIPGKLYEYLRTGRPIVAVCDRPSEVAALLEQTGLGRAFRPDETSQLSAHLESEFDRRDRGEPSVIEPDSRLRRFERAILTRRLADVFDTLSDSVKAS
jgi:glycosyltransferase involved in cell wall biosynthesis